LQKVVFSTVTSVGTFSVNVLAPDSGTRPRQKAIPLAASLKSLCCSW
jgi:hypothetical protein